MCLILMLASVCNNANKYRETNVIIHCIFQRKKKKGDLYKNNNLFLYQKIVE